MFPFIPALHSSGLHHRQWNGTDNCALTCYPDSVKAQSVVMQMLRMAGYVRFCTSRLFQVRIKQWADDFASALQEKEFQEDNVT